jgi:hypothetical protein
MGTTNELTQTGNDAASTKRFSVGVAIQFSFVSSTIIKAVESVVVESGVGCLPWYMVNKHLR